MRGVRPCRRLHVSCPSGEDFSALIVGVNLGGLGTLIASMASLISYKLIAREESQVKGACFRYFTAANVFLMILLVSALLFRG